MNRTLLYHHAVQREAREILAHYEKISPSLADDLWTEFRRAADYARKLPEGHHFDPSGRRRSNLIHFPSRTKPIQIRITGVRRHSRNPK